MAVDVGWAFFRSPEEDSQKLRNSKLHYAHQTHACTVLLHCTAFSRKAALHRLSLVNDNHLAAQQMALTQCRPAFVHRWLVFYTMLRHRKPPAAAGSNRLLRRVRVTRRAAAFLLLCPPQRRLASRLSYLPSTVPCPAMTRPRASCCRLWPHRSAPRALSAPSMWRSSQPSRAPPSAA